MSKILEFIKIFTKNSPKKYINNSTKLICSNASCILLYSHNLLDLNELKKSFYEIKRVTKKNTFISVGTYENQKEKKKLDDWAVLATTYMSKKNWLSFFKKVKYNGDFDWFKPK